MARRTRAARKVAVVRRVTVLVIVFVRGLDTPGAQLRYTIAKGQCKFSIYCETAGRRTHQQSRALALLYEQPAQQTAEGGPLLVPAAAPQSANRIRQNTRIRRFGIVGSLGLV